MNGKTYIFRSAQLIAIVGLLLGSINSSPAQQTGKVQISSLNVKEEIVPFINVIIEGNGITRKLGTTGVGDEYENGGLVELPVGIYRITSRNGNYFDFRRATFRVRPGIVTKINVYPLIYVRAQILMSDGSDRYELAPKPAYDVYNLPHGPDKDISMLIRYGKKRKTGDYVDYESSALADRKVMVSYDALSIYADKIRFDRKKFTLSAQGDVLVEDGTQRIKANKVTVRFNNGVPEVKTN
jgi:hypothetical protein